MALPWTRAMSVVAANNPMQAQRNSDMRRKNRAFLIALVSCLSFSSSLWAVGLGQLRADSSINQPLSVRIQLVDLGSTPLDEISVAVADVGNFDRLDVEVADNFPAIQISLGVDEEGPYARLE